MTTTIDDRPPSTAVDADNHYYEARDAFSRHLRTDDPDWVVELEEGPTQLTIGGRPYRFISSHYFDAVQRPGSLRERMRLIKQGGVVVDAERLEIPLAPAFLDRDARLGLMDEQGIEAAVLMPSIAVGIEQFLIDRPRQMYATLRAFNRWLDDDWGFAYQDRLFAAPLLNLTDLDAAVAELDWALERGARVIHLRAAPADGRSIADPHFDPFWARVQEAGVLTAFHISDSGYNRSVSVPWGEDGDATAREMSAWQWTCSYGDRPIMDTLAALVLHNLFGRFPGIQVCSLENGSLWVRYLLAAMDKYRGMGRHGRWIGGPVTGKPSEIFKQHVSVAPYHEEDVVDLAAAIGADRVLFGSDYPHAEGLARPLDYLESIATLPAPDQHAIMRGNCARLLHL